MLFIQNLFMTVNQKVEDVFIVSAARTPLGSMEDCLKVGSTLQDDVMMIDIDDITWHWWHWWPGCDCAPAWEQSNPSLSWESWCWSRAGGGGLHGLCTSGLNSSYLLIVCLFVVSKCLVSLNISIIIIWYLKAGLGQAPARQAALGAGLSIATPATTVNKVTTIVIIFLSLWSLSSSSLLSSLSSSL